MESLDSGNIRRIPVAITGEVLCSHNPARCTLSPCVMESAPGRMNGTSAAVFFTICSCNQGIVDISLMSIARIEEDEGGWIPFLPDTMELLSGREERDERTEGRRS